MRGPSLVRRTSLVFGLALAATSSAFADVTVTRQLGLEIAPDSLTAATLEAALNGFISDRYAGEISKRYVDPEHVAENEFFFENLPSGTSRSPDISYDPPSILRSYSPNNEDYYVTLRFTGTRGDEPFLYKLIEVKAVPTSIGFRFRCVFDERTADMKQHTIGDVTFVYEDTLDVERARDFVEFKTRFCALTGTSSEPMRYVKFRTLQRLLEAHGILYDASKCNFLAGDLGITTDGGRRFVTGMNDECYIRDFIHGHFFTRMDDVDELYRPFREGMAIYYGGTWGGVRLPEMIERFREEMERRPDIDFLDEFKMGRGSSVSPHFSYFFMSALLCRQVIETVGFDAALSLVYSGAEGERFFATLDEVLQVNEANFHETIVRLMGERPSAGPDTSDRAPN